MDQDGSNGGDGKGSDSIYILKIESTDFLINYRWGEKERDRLD